MPHSARCLRPVVTVLGVLALVSASVACSTEVEVRTTATDDPTPTAADDAGDPLAPDAATTSPADDTDAGEAAPDDTAPDDDRADGAAPDGAAPDGGADGSDQDVDAPLHTPARGEVVAVVGVASGETVAVRAAARPRARVITRLPALFDQAIATGQGRSNATTNWWQVLVGDDRGWVDASSMARLGATTDVTAEVSEELGATPDAPTMRALGRLVADARLGDDDQARIVLSGAPTVGDLGEVVYDIVGRADASVAGERLVVFATPDDGDGFVLRSVESTVFCGRGVTADGRCT